MKAVAAVFGMMVAAILLAFGFAPRRDVETSVMIAAHPAQVWAVLTDTSAYPAWNPGMVLNGALVPGHVIEHDEGGMVFHPMVVRATEAVELSWLGHIGPPRFFDALHYFRLVPVAGGTRFIQGERMRGVMLWLWDAGQLVPRFQAMNAALKARVERHP